MAPNSWISLILADTTKDSLQTCIEQIQANSQVPLDQMTKTDMHMTLVFLGANMRGLTPTKRAELESLMQTFNTAASATNEPSLEFEALELFPPTKRNLLIAKYCIKGENLAVLRKLQTNCFELNLVSKEEHANSQSTEFVAHITLGKFRGMRPDQISSVDRTVAKVNSGLDAGTRQMLSLPFEAACMSGRG